MASEYKIRKEFSTDKLWSMEQVMSHAKVLMREVQENILEEKIEMVSKTALKSFDPKFSFNVTVSEQDWDHRGIIEIIMFLNAVNPNAKNTASLALARRRIINKFSSLA